MSVICKKCGTDYKVVCHVCYPPDYLGELEKIVIETARYRFEHESYRNLPTAIHSVLKDLGTRMWKIMADTEEGK